jgi:hypothetical protein
MWIGKQQHTMQSCSPPVLGAPLHDDFDGKRISQCSDSVAGQPDIQGSIVVDLTCNTESNVFSFQFLQFKLN